MWLSFDMCSSYAWSKIIKCGDLLGEMTAGQHRAARLWGDREQRQEVTWQRDVAADVTCRGTSEGTSSWHHSREEPGAAPGASVPLVLQPGSTTLARHRAHALPLPCPITCRDDGMLRYL